jgi:hypothetical protein
LYSGFIVFLSSDELVALTGRTKSSFQIEFLRKRGYPFEVNAKRQPVVLREHVMQRLSAQAVTDDHDLPEPDFSYFGDA